MRWSERVGRLDFAGRLVRAPLGPAPDGGFDLRAAADRFALAEPDAAVRVSATVRGGGSLEAERLCEAYAPAGGRACARDAGRRCRAGSPRSGAPARTGFTGEG